MAEPILTRIESAIETLIKTMRTPDYNYDWNCVNVLDIAKCTFPSAVVVLNPNEINIDSAADDLYQNEVTFTIEVVGSLSTEELQPRIEINKVYNKCLDDLKKIFGINYSLSCTCDTIRYAASRREYRKNNDILLPGKLITVWKVSYCQSRIDPTTLG
jgi:hypothetical protein